MKLTIEINEEEIAELVTKEIASRIVAERDYIGREGQYGVRNGVDKAIQKYIYLEKDAIIERVVNRASVEIVKKGLPKLLDKLSEQN